MIGTGFIGTGLFYALERRPDLHYQVGLTRRDPGSVPEIDAARLTASLQRLIDECDVIVECSGDTVHATPLIRRALEAGRPVVTMNSELQVTAGSRLQRLGYLTEAEGDQPGSIAALRRDVVAMGFEPIVYGNVKGFLNHTPTRPEMEKWAALQGISVAQVTSFTDGTRCTSSRSWWRTGSAPTSPRAAWSAATPSTTASRRAPVRSPRSPRAPAS